MKTIDQCNFKDKKALIRVDFNVPLTRNLTLLMIKGCVLHYLPLLKY
jgi:3-phosphoglycerate kinase